MTAKMGISNPKVAIGHNNCLIMKQMILEGLCIVLEISLNTEIETNVEIILSFTTMMIAQV